MEKWKHLMVDIESFGTTADSVVLSIGAVPFNLDGNIGKDFEVYPKVQNQFSNRSTHWTSIQWWFKQEQSVRFQQADANRCDDLNSCLNQFSSFCLENLSENFKIWGNGFDIALLNHSYEQYGMKTPWSYKNILDVRTLVWLSKISVKKYEIDKTKAHDALNDCKYQISFLIDGYKILKDY